MKFVLPYLGLRFTAGCIRYMPMPMISMLSSCIAWLIYHVFRYRTKVALRNLQMCFPDQSEDMLKKMLPAVYRNITDVFLETIKTFSTSPADILRYIEVPDKTQLEFFHTHFKGAILATAHLANWEWCGYCLHEILKVPGIAVYRPIKNPRVDAMMRKHREMSRMSIVPMRQIVKQLASGHADSHFVLLIADQSADPDGAQWEKFFGIETAFFKGPATLALRYELPIFFVHLERTRRHHYRMHLEPLCLNPKNHDVSSITRMYVQKLEASIRKSPEGWLWTHRRWKHAPPGKEPMSWYDL